MQLEDGGHRSACKPKKTGSSELVSAEQVGPFDVLLGRGTTTYIHPGNILFRKAVKAWSAAYQRQSDVDKDMTARTIISLVEGSEGRFLRPASDGEQWVMCSRVAVRSKVKQALRDDTRKREHEKAEECVQAEDELLSTAANSFLPGNDSHAYWLKELHSFGQGHVMTDSGSTNTNREETRQPIAPEGLACQNFPGDGLAINQMDNLSVPGLVPSHYAALPQGTGTIQEVPLSPSSDPPMLGPDAGETDASLFSLTSAASVPQPSSLEPLPFAKLSETLTRQSKHRPLEDRPG